MAAGQDYQRWHYTTPTRRGRGAPRARNGSLLENTRENLSGTANQRWPRRRQQAQDPARTNVLLSPPTPTAERSQQIWIAEAEQRDIPGRKDQATTHDSRPFARIRVFSPRPKSPRTPSTRITSLAAAPMANSAHLLVLIRGYYALHEILVALTGPYVLTTRSEFETVSEMADDVNLIKAWRRSFCPVVSGFGRWSLR